MEKDLVDTFFEKNSLVRQHIESFNYFIDKEISDIVAANSIVDSDIDKDFYLKYLNIRVEKPTSVDNMVELNIYPSECRIRDLTYAGDIFVDIEYIKNRQIVIKRNVNMGRMPIMLRSSKCHLDVSDKLKLGQELDTNGLSINYKAHECIYDNGGYFIIKGVEKVIQIQEQLSKNRIILETGKNGIYSSVTSASIKHKSKTNVILKNDIFYVQSNIFSEEIPLIMLLKAMGLKSDKQILEYIGKECSEILEATFDENFVNNIFTEEQALDELSHFVRLGIDEDKIKGTKRQLCDKIIPNVECPDDCLINKGIYLCLMTRKLILAKQGKFKADDKDYLGNKRFELAGQLLSILFEDTFKKFNFELKKAIDKIISKRTRTSEFDALTYFNLQTGTVTSTLARAISSGNWNLKRFRMERSGVTHVLTRYSYITALGMMTKINSHFEKTRKVSGPRSLHTSSWGMFCPADTPEGESCGLVKNLALMTEITTESDVQPVIDTLFDLGMVGNDRVSEDQFYKPGVFLVYINGSMIGITKNAIELCKLFRQRRREGFLDKFVSIVYNDVEKAVFVSTDNGRICRPLIIVEKNNAFFKNYILQSENYSGKSFADLLREGLIEYLDVNEENNCLISLAKADTNKLSCGYTHLEIADYSLLSLVAGLVPFPHHNQSPRNTYQCAMGKQAIGHVGTNVKKRYDNLNLQLNYTQRPMAASKILDINKYNKIPSGYNAMVAVMSYSGYDIEDAVILNKDSIDRGFARVEVYRTVKIEFERMMNGRSEEVFIKDGMEQVAKVGSLMKDGDPLVQKVSPVDGAIKTIKHKGYDAYVDRVLVTMGENGKVIKIVMRETRRPEIGDKFSSRHGQKGVVGLIVPQINLPFNEHGISPDLIMNPHGFPSRMTVGKIYEQIFGKLLV